jgi:hypothetical protein
MLPRTKSLGGAFTIRLVPAFRFNRRAPIREILHFFYVHVRDDPVSLAICFGQTLFPVDLRVYD